MSAEGDDFDSDECRAARRASGRCLFIKESPRCASELESDGCGLWDLEDHETNSSVGLGLWIWERGERRRLTLDEMDRAAVGESVFSPGERPVYTMAAELAAWRRIALAPLQFGHAAIAAERRAGEEELRAIGVDPVTGKRVAR